MVIKSNLKTKVRFVVSKGAKEGFTPLNNSPNFEFKLLTVLWVKITGNDILFQHFEC